MNKLHLPLLLILIIALLCPLPSCKKQGDRPQTTRRPFDASVDGIAVRPLKNIDPQLALRIINGDQEIPPVGADEVVAAPEPTRPIGPAAPVVPTMGPGPASPAPVTPTAPQPAGGYSFNEDANDIF